MHITEISQKLDSIDWGRPQSHYPARGQAPEIYATRLKLIVSGRKGGALAYNLGNGQGFSVQQVIDVVQKVVVAEDGCSLVVETGERRIGDPSVLVADATLAKKVLNWEPEYVDLETIIRHAWAWEKQSNTEF